MNWQLQHPSCWSGGGPTVAAQRCTAQGQCGGSPSCSWVRVFLLRRSISDSDYVSLWEYLRFWSSSESEISITPKTCIAVLQRSFLSSACATSSRLRFVEARMLPPLGPLTPELLFDHQRQPARARSVSARRRSASFFLAQQLATFG